MNVLDKMNKDKSINSMSDILESKMENEHLIVKLVKYT